MVDEVARPVKWLLECDELAEYTAKGHGLPIWFVITTEQILSYDITKSITGDVLRQMETAAEAAAASRAALTHGRSSSSRRVAVSDKRLLREWFRMMAVKLIENGHGGWAQYCVPGLGSLGSRPIGSGDVKLLAGALQRLAAALGNCLAFTVGGRLAAMLKKAKVGKDERGKFDLREDVELPPDAVPGKRALLALARFFRAALDTYKRGGTPSACPPWPEGTMCVAGWVRPRADAGVPDECRDSQRGQAAGGEA